MTSKLTRERIEWLNYAATGLAANGTEMAMSPQDVIALTEYCLAAMGSEPVAYAVSNDFWNQGNHKQHIDGKQCDLFFPGDIIHGEKFEPDDYDYVFPLYRHAQPAPASEPIGFRCRRNDGLGDWFHVYHRAPDEFERKHLVIENIYTAPQPAPVAYSDFEEFWSAYIHPLAQDDELKDFAWGIWNACVSNAQPAPVVLENCVTAEHRRVIEMLLNVCGAAFELADDSCQQDVDGEDCHVVPNSAFQKLSDMLDEIENSLPTEDADRPDVFLAWSAMPRASLKSLLQAGNSPLWVGVDWAKGCEPGNSPVIPEGYVMVPKEPTEAMMLHNSGCQHHAWDDPDCAMRQTRRLIWSHMLTAALREVES
ncbi:hypothetical protein [Klebsiella spallanzanii]|uniref:hypothetical protein n=1 Tax=Klebsiella spallanzanii TaxID=2587528 RepID=UPI001F2545B7|nr:hypothetical protein [Klebsiella spallanzanii]